jgi:DNA-binding response OmpR family regulator
MKKILVIDDEEPVRKAFSLALEDTDYQVDTAESGEKGIEKYKNEGHDMIYLDLKMQGMNGVETLREIRKINDTVPVYIVTAFHQEFFGQLKSVQEDGISFELLNKPVNLDQIIMVTEGVLGK